MAKKKPNFLKRSSQLMRRHKAVTILCIVSCLVLVLSLGSFVMTRYRDYQNKKIVFQLIDDIKALHAEMEQELGVTLDVIKDCMLPQDKSSTAETDYSCEIGVQGHYSTSTREKLLEQVRNIGFFNKESPLSQADGFLYDYRNSLDSSCAIRFTETSELFYVRCTFSARHLNKQAILDKLEDY